jgi:ribosome biogenesis protein Nip4
MCLQRAQTDQHRGRRNRRSDTRPELRVGTAERSEVADALSQHFAEGRLDTTEFNERSEQAMTAKTRADLSSLLSDLPGHAPSPSLPNRRRRKRVSSVAVLALLVVAAVWAASLPHALWVFGAVIVFIVWRHQGGRVG